VVKGEPEVVDTRNPTALLEYLIETHGSVANVAEVFGVTRMTVYQWRKNGMPISIVNAIELGRQINAN
jgi:plasmid maintenance system antidote protein VapI